MRPKKKQYTLEMPLTFENRDKYRTVGKQHFFFAGIILLAWFVITVLIVIKGDGPKRVTYPLILLAVLVTIIRLFIIKEKHYLTKKRELEANDYLYDHNLFWDIYEIGERYPYICRYVSGMKAIFVVFEKDVIVGRVEDNDYFHAEAVADAYLQMVKRNITCMHVDYMDSVGKDARMEGLFEAAANTENEDLRGLLTVVYDNVQQQMHKTYDSYDVYCFYYSGVDSLFWDELKDVLEYFLRANYLNARVLNAHGVGDLAKTLANLQKFSVSSATSKLFVGGVSNYITPIWVKKGVEKTVLNQTIEEQEDASRISKREREIRQANKKFKRSRRGKILEKVRKEEELDLFGDDTTPRGDVKIEKEKTIELQKKGDRKGIEKDTGYDILEEEVKIDNEENLWDIE